ncbi:septal ring lytic transglycosylase RlpA family protein [Flavilitoribacter nigricans]|uniref:septal ring lytic transglycosylase RlpA family protein n=1 Tax=Flavilitoribacter nigricans TaxID=70997 RepID=UPI001C9E41E0|nr:septal ring lytic transglycosylase RlpA family protein [Flavilitoribacter nigricans]
MAVWFSPLSAQNFSTAERGIAVYYADYLEGQPTAYGEVYRRNELTAAHRSLPAGTLLKVTRLDNQRSVVVRVNDRGAFCDGCVVDLSKAAAIQLDLIRSGRAMVSVDVVGQQAPNVAADTRLQRENIALYERPTYSTVPANRHSSYPRPDAGFQTGNTYAKSAPSSYGETQPMRINVSPTPAAPATTNTASGNSNLQAKGGLNAYNQIEAFDSYNYYKAQQAERRAVNNTARSEAETYERLRARGLLPEENATNNDASFYDRGGLQQPSSYDEPEITARGATPNPQAYVQYSNSPTSLVQPQSYGAESSRISPQLTAKSPLASVSARGSYAIQMASYRNFDNAQRQLQKLKQMGMATAYLLETDYKGDKLYKVLNGPFGDKETATGELARYKRDYLLDGIVILLN